MDATTMRLTTLLANKLRGDFPAYQFVASDDFRWSPTKQTIYYDEASDDRASLLHELSHATLNHTAYTKDIELIEMERDAWEHTRQSLSVPYDVPVSDETVQQSLDTYRDWLHARSTCPHCTAVGIQTKKSLYKCIACSTKWRVNDARVCALRRYKQT